GEGGAGQEGGDGLSGGRGRGTPASVYPGLPVRFVHNPRFAETDNILSLALAFERVPLDDVVLLECDLVCEPAVMCRLLESPHRTVALVDRWRTGMGGRAAVDRRPRSRGRACHPSSRRRPRSAPDRRTSGRARCGWPRRGSGGGRGSAR